MKSSSRSENSLISTKSGAYTSRASELTKINPELRDLKLYCDQLYREIERKDARNDGVMKEMQVLRTTNANLQRDLKMINIAYEKVKTEKFQLNNELMKSKEELEKMSDKMRYLEDAQGLSTQIDRNKAQSVILQEDIFSLKGTVALRDRKIEALERELEIAHRSMNIQDKYEKRSVASGHNSHGYQSSFLDSNNQINKEAMRTLYYELGKRQTDLHSLAISLADAHKECDQLKMSISHLTTHKETLTVENTVLRQRVEQHEKDQEQHKLIVAALHQDIQQEKDNYRVLELQLRDYANKLKEMRNLHEEMVSEKSAKIADLVAVVGILEKEKGSLATKCESVQSSMQYFENLAKLNEQKMNKEIGKVVSENNDLRRYVAENDALNAQVSLLRNNLHDALKINEQHVTDITALRADVNKLHGNVLPTMEYNLQNSNARLLSYEDEISHCREVEAQIVSERNEAVEALRQTMAAARDISHKYEQEREARLVAEKLVNTLQKAKENISSAVLDALQKERLRCAALERSLEDIPLELRYNLLNMSTTTAGGGHAPPSSSSVAAVGRFSAANTPSDNPHRQRSSPNSYSLYDIASGSAILGSPSPLKSSLLLNKVSNVHAHSHPHSHPTSTHTGIQLTYKDAMPPVPPAHPAAIVTNTTITTTSSLDEQQEQDSVTASRMRADSLNNSTEETAAGHSNAYPVQQHFTSENSPTKFHRTNPIERPLAMVDELKRLRDELRSIEDSASAAGVESSGFAQSSYHSSYSSHSSHSASVESQFPGDRFNHRDHRADQQSSGQFIHSSILHSSVKV